MLKITETTHDNGRAFRTTQERFLSMEQGLNAHDPFINPVSKGLVSEPRWFGPPVSDADCNYRGWTRG